MKCPSTVRMAVPALLMTAMTCLLPTNATAATPRQNEAPQGLPRIGSADSVGQIAGALADGDGKTAAHLICRYGVVNDPIGLGHSLSTADNRVLDMGATDDQVDRFAAAVDDAYRIAGVPRQTAATSFVVGLADMGKGYGANPVGPVHWSSSQAAIGSGILLRVIPGWAASPVPPAECAQS